VRKETDYNIAFVLDDDGLRRLDEVLRSSGLPISYSLRLSDGTTTDNYENLDAVRALANSSRRSVEYFQATAGAWNSPTQCEVTMRNWGPLETDVRGPEASVATLTNRLDEWAEGIHPWYSRLATMPLGLIVFMVVWTGTIFVTATFWIPSSTAEPLLRAALNFQQTGIVSILQLVLMAGWAVRGKLFPRAAFAWGGGAKREARRAFWRNWGGGTLVTVLLGLLVAAIWRAIATP